jgi:hypothetical protein
MLNLLIHRKVRVYLLLYHKRANSGLSEPELLAPRLQFELEARKVCTSQSNCLVLMIDGF